MAQLIAICGMAWSGKSTVTDIVEQYEFHRVHLGSTEMVLQAYGYTNEELERQAREQIRKELGMGAMVLIMLESIHSYLKQGKNVVIDNMYSRSEYKILKEHFGDAFTSIAVHASPRIRHQRLLTREVRPLSKEQARSRDYAEIENIEKGWPIALSDYHIINEQSTDDLRKQVEAILKKIIHKQL